MAVSGDGGGARLEDVCCSFLTKIGLLGAVAMVTVVAFFVGSKFTALVELVLR
jgi:hypothetical protein